MQKVNSGIDRRSFLSGTLTLTATAALAACSTSRPLPAESSVEDNLTGTFTGRLGTSASRLGYMVLGAA